MKRSVEITLKSDLCAGVGKYYAAMIDLDTAIDEYGIPFIPSKRIKGVLREIASVILGFDSDKIDRMFGVPGISSSGSVRIGDAVVEDYEAMIDDIRTHNYPPALVTSVFCSIRMQSAMENDIAKKGSLRSVRVVNRKNPMKNEEMKFYADIEFNDGDLNDIIDLFKGLRNIGYHRNRGLGSVICKVIEQEKAFDLPEMPFDKTKEYIINYTLYLKEDLIFPSNSFDRSLDYIPGASVLGAFAGAYIKKYGDSDFNSLFLSGKVRFGNLYISDRSGSFFYPAPRFLGRIKATDENKDKGIKNPLKENLTEKQFKTLKNGYINEKYGLKNVKTEIAYHNALLSEEGLYMQYCVSSGQYFSGSIIADGEKMERIYPLFAKGELSFGKSKTAQYSRCIVTSVKVNEHCERTIMIRKGEKTAYILESDLVLLDENGNHSVSFDEICKALGVDMNTVDPFSNIATRVVSGYNAKWNLKKPQFPAYVSGSSIIFTAEKDTELPERFVIGEKQNEGYGVIRVLPNADLFEVTETSNIGMEEKNSSVFSEKIEEIKKESKRIDKAILTANKIGENTNKDGKTYTSSLNSTQTSRIILMAKESSDYGDFKKRLDSIKTNDVKKDARFFFGNLNGDWKDLQQEIILTLTVRKYQLRGGKNEFRKNLL